MPRGTTEGVNTILALINNTYTPNELHNCKALFIAAQLRHRDNKPCLESLRSSQDLQKLEKSSSYITRILQDEFKAALRLANPHDVCNLQFTSGTTGMPKAAMLTHHNIVNNAALVGQRISLTDKDVLCCPPPLYHCFGLVLGLLACIVHGATVVFPSEGFDANLVIQAVLEENCTALHGVPAMLVAELRLLRKEQDFSKPLMEQLRQQLNLIEIINTYGILMTLLWFSGSSFMTSCTDPLERRLATVGKIMPHTSAKIIDRNGNTVGYWKNPEKTQEVMIKDKDGVLWMHTEDEASFDHEGYCTITGRIKDIIIRGSENMFPAEIESRLIQHEGIANASVVGIKDSRFGEVVGAFLESRDGKISDDEVWGWVGQTLARQKVLNHIFWLGDACGKVKKSVLQDIINKLIEGK
ncbi:acetyl-CoA synthetase-like protein [Thozetella sp. PMI_491]|nr:acetyl-CoA synthetase-like protein [Thozetella sp. PMI_491]